MLKTFLHDEAGATAIEYGLIAALISVVILASLIMLGNAMENTFGFVRDQVDRAVNGGDAT